MLSYPINMSMPRTREPSAIYRTRRPKNPLDNELNRSKGTERRYRISTLPRPIPRRKSFRHVNGKRSKIRGSLQPRARLQTPPSYPGSGESDSGIRRSIGRNEGERRERSSDPSRESLRKIGEPPNGGENSAVQTKSNKHQAPIVLYVHLVRSKPQSTSATCLHLQDDREARFFLRREPSATAAAIAASKLPPTRNAIGSKVDAGLPPFGPIRPLVPGFEVVIDV